MDLFQTDCTIFKVAEYINEPDDVISLCHLSNNHPIALHRLRDASKGILAKFCPMTTHPIMDDWSTIVARSHIEYFEDNFGKTRFDVKLYRYFYLRLVWNRIWQHSTFPDTDRFQYLDEVTQLLVMYNVYKARVKYLRNSMPSHILDDDDRFAVERISFILEWCENKLAKMDRLLIRKFEV